MIDLTANETLTRLNAGHARWPIKNEAFPERYRFRTLSERRDGPQREINFSLIPLPFRGISADL